jgi:hypothetical protein
MWFFAAQKEQHASPLLSFELTGIRLQQLCINALASAEEYEGSRVANLSQFAHCRSTWVLSKVVQIC